MVVAWVWPRVEVAHMFVLVHLQARVIVLQAGEMAPATVPAVLPPLLLVLLRLRSAPV